MNQSMKFMKFPKHSTATTRQSLFAGLFLGTATDGHWLPSAAAAPELCPSNRGCSSRLVSSCSQGGCMSPVQTLSRDVEAFPHTKLMCWGYEELQSLRSFPDWSTATKNWNVPCSQKNLQRKKLQCCVLWKCWKPWPWRQGKVNVNKSKVIHCAPKK